MISGQNKGIALRSESLDEIIEVRKWFSIADFLMHAWLPIQ